MGHRAIGIEFRGLSKGTVHELVESVDVFPTLCRLAGLPVALEGALKLKEISYIATDAYAANRRRSFCPRAPSVP